MSADKAKRPIVIKRVHGEEEEHGGHWKIAYADFVTAMMAFFLVMWLLASVTEKQKRGLARYFNATSIMDMRTGDGVMDGGKSMLDGMTAQMVPVSTSAEDGSTDADASRDAATGTSLGNAAGAANGASSTTALRSSDAAGMAGDRTEAQQMDAMKAEIERMARDGELKSQSRNVLVEVTPDGLRVQIFDRDGEPMFAPGAAEPNRRLSLILDALMPVFASVRNSMTISGHTDSLPTGSTSYSNWELSADRANGTRRYLEAHGLAPGRVVKVEGRAAVDPLVTGVPGDPRNRRISLTLLRADAAAAATNGARPATVPAGHT